MSPNSKSSTVVKTDIFIFLFLPDSRSPHVSCPWTPLSTILMPVHLPLQQVAICFFVSGPPPPPAPTMLCLASPPHLCSILAALCPDGRGRGGRGGSSKCYKDSMNTGLGGPGMELQQVTMC